MTGLRWAGLIVVVGALALGPTDAPGRASGGALPSTEVLAPLDGPRVANCLARAGELIGLHAGRLAELRESLRARRTPEPGSPGDAFAAFEGAWEGHWGAMPVRHLWWSPSPDVQLVVVQDGDVVADGINVRDGRGVLCGLMREPSGDFRPHEGRRVPLPGGGSGLVWRTPDRAYVEWVTHGGQHYLIEEWVVRGRRAARGTTAAYSRWR